MSSNPRSWPRLIWIEIDPNVTRALRYSGFTVVKHSGYTVTATIPEGWTVHSEGGDKFAVYDQEGNRRVSYEKGPTHRDHDHSIRIQPRLKVRQEPARPNLYMLVDIRMSIVLKAAQTKTGLMLWSTLRYPLWRLPWAYWDRRLLRPWWLLWRT